jgi:hypothetical protein
MLTLAPAATRYTVASHLSSAVWTFTTALSAPYAARQWYAEVNEVPLDSVSVGTREER